MIAGVDGGFGAPKPSLFRSHPNFIAVISSWMHAQNSMVDSYSSSEIWGSSPSMIISLHLPRTSDCVGLLLGGRSQGSKGLA